MNARELIAELGSRIHRAETKALRTRTGGPLLAGFILYAALGREVAGLVRRRDIPATAPVACPGSRHANPDEKDLRHAA
jgi:hypothetical protein